MSIVTQLQPRGTPQRQSRLHPDATVCIIRRGETVLGNDDLQCVLTDTGIARAQQLGRTFEAIKRRAYFHYIVASADRSSRQTAHEAFAHYGEVSWVDGAARQLYAPQSDAGYAEMCRVHREVASQRDAHIASSASYNVYKLLDTGCVIDQLKKEARATLLSFSGIGDARRIAIVAHGVICNVIAEALFPQHKRKIEEIELEPCDFIMVSNQECRYFPLIPQPD